MPLWLDLLRTPMAAPETTRLRRMRRTFQLLCVSTALAVMAIKPLVVVLGLRAPLVIGALLTFCALHALRYAREKHRADTAWIAALTEEHP
ncbi:MULTISPECIES: hypothetical protein [unclassified Novosphingobium]|uniref:hypothetical protein n=1 Tax=unclassified Novosphingobium TaxID=2644732 RepID=UPI0006C88CF8|nr:MULTISPECIES: hypothetical protein [unclassified Novosphingobium]KPH67037.1 hypothetical protein ADT71_03135 [Novosphingobium sp. ST904]MPS71413.1 hypothetical protein [Novosphingobium sp.]TCM28100.1 hypothetical protein EDF59_1309 [Novosphingobium sp. ST904]